MGFNSAFKGLIYYSKSALHVSGDVFVHHQQHSTVFAVSGSVHPSFLPAGSNLVEHYHILQIQLSAADDGRKHRPKHVEPTWNNKLIYIVHLVGYFHGRVFMCAVIQVQHSLRICCGSTSNKDLLPSRYHHKTKVSERVIR